MEQDEFESRLQEALSELFKRDAFLLENYVNINERSVTHRLGIYLADLFPEWDVDCEYNRMMIGDREFTEGDYWAKRLALPSAGEISQEDTEAKTVYPDIIIHKRGTRENLAVIEIKMEWKRAKKNFDYIKLEAYKSELKYSFAVYIELGKKAFIDFI